MALEVGEGKVAKWGGSIGIRISAAQARALGLVPGQDVTFRLVHRDERFDLGEIPVVHGGGNDAAEHDRLLGEARWRDLRRDA